MPSKKEQPKAPQVKGDEAADLILDYLRKQNRPYSATDISANLHNVVTKTSAAKVLKELSEKGELEVKTSGKQAVYHIRQDPSDYASPEELAEIKSEIEGLKNEVANLKSEHKTLSQTVQQLRSIPSSDELEIFITKLEEETNELRERLQTLQSGDVEPVSVEEKQKVDRDLRIVSSLLPKHRKAFNDFWKEISHNLAGEGGAQGLWDELGLETPPAVPPQSLYH